MPSILHEICNCEGGSFKHMENARRENLEAALIRGEIKYRTLFDEVNDAVFLVKDYRFLDCNTSALKMYGCSRDEIIGKHPYEFSPTLQTDGRYSKEKALEKMETTLNGIPQVFEWKHIKFDGTPFDAENKS